MLSQHVHPSWSKNSSKALILDLFRILSRGNQKLPGYKGILVSPHRFHWFGISQRKSALLSFLRGFQWIIPSPPPTNSSLKMEKPSKNEISKGSLYELLAVLEWTMDDFEQADFSKEMHRTLSRQRHYQKELDRIFRSFDISHSVAPQGFFLDSFEISRKCHERKIPSLMVENTFLHDRILVEPTDPNYFIGKCLSSHAEDFSSLKKVTRREIDQRVRNHLIRPKSDQHRTSGGKIPASLKNYVLFLGQVFTDASLIFNQCDYSKNCIALMSEIIAISKSLGKPIVLKLHPKEHHGFDPVNFRPYDNLTHRKLLDAGISEAPDEGIFIDFEDRWSTFELMQNASLAITINSQSGFEAMLLGKEVISCGNSYYGNLKSCITPKDKDSLSSAMKRTLIEGMKANDQSECWNFFDYIRNDYFIKKHKTNVFSKIDRRLKENFYKN